MVQPECTLSRLLCMWPCMPGAAHRGGHCRCRNLNPSMTACTRMARLVPISLGISSAELPGLAGGGLPSQQGNHVPAHLASLRIVAEVHGRSLSLLELVGNHALHNGVVLLASKAAGGA